MTSPLPQCCWHCGCRGMSAVCPYDSDGDTDLRGFRNLGGLWRPEAGTCVRLRGIGKAYKRKDRSAMSPVFLVCAYKAGIWLSL
jgi:hypothetical protein